MGSQIIIGSFPKGLALGLAGPFPPAPMPGIAASYFACAHGVIGGAGVPMPNIIHTARMQDYMEAHGVPCPNVPRWT
jgi:hypothetical protein